MTYDIVTKVSVNRCIQAKNGRDSTRIHDLKVYDPIAGDPKYNRQNL